ncbi:MAG: DUF4255 domain-containing protein [Acidobacteria bacterium]|nr:DUF4255 domain-containing protein [Acidobacteriota bacterium]MBI3428088.1 DUF4255 domain-containing protein [Acidobacteriota bacterium]
MGTYHAIAATSKAIIESLRHACPRPEFESAAFELYQSSNFQSPMTEGVSLYLYRVGTSLRRNLPPRVGPFGEQYRPPLPLDLYYLLTAWGRTAERQQFLLGWAMSEMNDTPILPATVLNHYLQAPEGDVFHADEEITLTFEPLTLQDMANLWEPLKPNLQASANYVVRMVALDSRVRVNEFAPVQTREFAYVNGGRA